MPYTHDRRWIAGFVIDEPDGDRPYFCHKLPLEYVRKASARGGRVYAFELELKEGALPGVCELDVTRGKVLADVNAALGEVTRLRLDCSDDESELRSLRSRALATAVQQCRVVEAVDWRLFELDPEGVPIERTLSSRTTSPEPAIEIATLPWRGSVTDLATDIRCELSANEIRDLIEALTGSKRGT